MYAYIDITLFAPKLKGTYVLSIVIERMGGKKIQVIKSLSEIGEENTTMKINNIEKKQNYCVFFFRRVCILSCRYGHIIKP